MFTLTGKYATATIFTDYVDDGAASQIIQLCSQPLAEGAKIRIMPDVHYGNVSTVGTTMTIKDKIIPNIVGCDIGCGMETVVLEEKEIDLKRFDKAVYAYIPAGARTRSEFHSFVNKVDLEKLHCFDYIDLRHSLLSIGTLGGGNHFIEVDKDDDGNLYIVIHSGSRMLGLSVAKYYQRRAYQELNGSSPADIEKLTADLIRQGRKKDVKAEVTKRINTKFTSVPKDYAYCQGALFEQYVEDMKIVQEYAQINRKAMINELVENLGLHVKDEFSTVHNYLDTDYMILRKGAVSAQKGEKILIPINMRDGSLIAIGKGNPEWNYSAPHGAGRLMSRGEAKKHLTLEEYEFEMDGIYSTSVNLKTIDESPMAYKSIEAIIDNIGDTVEIQKIIKPIYNYKAGGAEG